MDESPSLAYRTVGMRLDAAINELNSLSSTQLYALIVGLTILISLILLGRDPEAPPHDERKLQQLTTTTTTTKARSDGDAPEPRWHIFRYVNYAAIAIFGWGVADFGLHYSSYMQESDVLLKFLLGFCVLLCYFFGFFGVSLVHDTIGEPEPSPTTNSSVAKSPITATATTTKINSKSSKTKKDVLPPAPSAPVCSDPVPMRISRSTNVAELSNGEIVKLVLLNQIKDHELEKRLEDCHRAVAVRRMVVASKLDALGHTKALEKLPHEHSLDYGRVHGANCEIVVGYVPLPVGIVGPLTLNGESVFVPMATTEGCLVASTNRGAKAISQGGGAYAEVVRDGITRAPCVRMESAQQAAALKIWCEQPVNFETLKAAFESTTSFGRLIKCAPTIAGKNVYLRLQCQSGDAMGMNMVSKGSLAVIECLKDTFGSLQLVALSGNMCTDKKAAATNWIEGRGKSVVVEATIPREVVRTTLKTTVKALVETNLHKNLVGSAMAGTIGGFNAHASNIVTAVFLATGQDPAQNVESSNCITLLEETEDGDLWISCTMPSLEVGTVGGGTSLEAQSACLQAIGCKGGAEIPGENSRFLAKVVAAATMAGELSLIAALAANTLVAAHMQHNRKPATTGKK